jgi:hypothetical protein
LKADFCIVVAMFCEGFKEYKSQSEFYFHRDIIINPLFTGGEKLIEFQKLRNFHKVTQVAQHRNQLKALF